MGRQPTGHNSPNPHIDLALLLKGEEGGSVRALA